MTKSYRECAIDHLKANNLCKGYIDYIVDEMEKLDKIEQIVNEKTTTSDGQFFVGDWKIDKIKRVLESED